jgi:anti-anti-sigma regulatory factor
MAETDSKIVELPSVVDLDALDTVRDRLLDALDQGPVTVSAGAVERVSTNALFLLLSAAETARRNNTTFALTSVSASLAAAIERLGLAPQFAVLQKGQR